MSRTYYVYIMSNVSKTLYIGVTNDLVRRVAEHRLRRPGSFTAKYGLTMLVYHEEYASPGEAIVREKQLKGWLRARKLQLVAGANPDWLDLAADWERALPAS